MTSPTQVAQAITKKKRNRLSTYFIQGLIAILPLLLSVLVLVFLVRFVEKRLDGVVILLPKDLRDSSLIVYGMEFAAFVLVCALVILWGMIVKSIIGRAIMHTTARLFEAIPGVSTIYRASRQALEVLTLDRDHFLAKPVLVAWPTPERWAIAFNTGRVNDPRLIPDDSGRVFYTVFIPHTPNPTSGYLAVVSEDKLRNTDITVEDAIKMVLTGGMVKPKGTSDPAGPPARA